MQGNSGKERQPPMSDPTNSADLAIFDDEQAEERIRRVWHEGRWFFSVIDVIGFLTEGT